MTARCYCGRPVPASSGCGCCCANHDVDVAAVARALATIGTQPVRVGRTDGGPSIREYLAAKGEAFGIPARFDEPSPEPIVRRTR